MLRDGGSGVGYDYSCYLPFYNTADTSPNTWIVGSIVLDDFYSVYDFTAENGDVAVGLGHKDPSFDYTSGGGGIIPEHIKKHGAVIATVIIFVIIGLAVCGFIYKKKKAKESNFVFETYKDYQDFGSMKQGKQNASKNIDKVGVNYSESHLASSAENSGRILESEDNSMK